MAFEAGFDGLTRYLSDGMTPAVVAGYLFNAADELELDLLTTRGDVRPAFRTRCWGPRRRARRECSTTIPATVTC